MKKVFLNIVALLTMAVIVPSVSAASVSTEQGLIDALAGTDTTITLAGDIELTKSIEVGRTVTLKLNGYDITAKDGMADDSLIIVLHGGTLTIEGSGSINASNSNASARIAVKMTKGGNIESFINSNPATLIVKSGTLYGSSFAISGNGNPDRVNTNVTINGGTIEAGGTGIFHPQAGSLTINGGTVKGKTGIEMRSGDLVVNGGNIIGTGSPASSTGNLSGTTTVGAGIAVAQHTTKKVITVTVNDGNIQGYSALYESNPQSNSTMDMVTLNIEGGTFEAINGGTEAVYSEDKTNFITGGTFSSDVETYVDNTKTAVKDETTGEYYVGNEYQITAKKATNGTLTVQEKAVEGAPVKVTVKASEGYEFDKIKVKTASGANVKVSGKTFTMPSEDVTVTAVFEKIENPDTADNIMIAFVLGMISLSGIAYISLKNRKAFN